MSDLTNNQSGVESVLRVGHAAAEIKQMNSYSAPFVLMPEGYKLISIEDTLTEPMRKKAHMRMRDEKSFAAYFNLHQTENSQIYGQIDPPKFLGVIDDNGASITGWREHKVSYECPFSHQWETWSEKDGKAQTQQEFAAFIERNLPDVIIPIGAEMLEISRSLEAKKKVNFKSAIRLDNGQVQFGYEEEIQGTSAKGTLQIPETFTIGIPVFESGSHYQLQCRLRYRISDAQLRMWYEIIRPHEYIEDAMKEVWTRIEQSTERIIFNSHL